MDNFNQFEQARFSRTQPTEWRSIPFADDSRPLRAALKVVVIILLWFALAALSLWSINQNAQPQVHVLKGAK